MSPVDFKNPSITLRLDRAMRRERLRTILKIAGVAFVIAGIFMATGPFGPPVSSTVAIPKADIHAGLWLVQALSPVSARRIGFLLTSGGAAMLLFQFFLRTRGTRDDDIGKP
jgi:hypothetical protein